MTENRALTTAQDAHALADPLVMWAEATTDPDSRRHADLVRDKARAVRGFFEWCGKPPEAVTEIDIKTWEAELTGRGLAPATRYAMISRLSSFYNWALKDEALKQRIKRNPVNMARPRAPKAYQNEAVKALDTDQVKALLGLVRARAGTGDLVAKRDYALLLFYFATGMRRAEVINLRWGDIKINGGLRYTSKVKGGTYREREIADPRVAEALKEYLHAAGRWGHLDDDDPLWTRHDRAGKPGAALTSHAFAKRFKRYGQQAGLGDIHLHMIRHTVARAWADLSGSENEVQELLGHKNVNTTRIYLDRIKLHRDRASTPLLNLWEV